MNQPIACENCGHPISPEGVYLPPSEDVDTTGKDRPRCADTACVAEDRANGLTFEAWLSAAGRVSSASDFDLRAAWRAGEDPAEYTD